MNHLCEFLLKDLRLTLPPHMMVLLVMKVTTSPAPLLPVPTLWEQSAAPWTRLNTTW